MPEEYRDDDEDASRSMIHRAAGRGDVSMAVQLLDEDPALINDRNELDNQPLHEACWAKHLDMVRLLIDRGADVNARGDFSETPLHYAVRDDGAASNAIVALLLRSSADIEAKDERLQQNALGWALREFNNDLEPAIQMLRERGSSLGLEGAMILGDIDRSIFFRCRCRSNSTLGPSSGATIAKSRAWLRCRWASNAADWSAPT